MDASSISITSLARIPDLIRTRHPLVHCLTNDVVKNFTANALLSVQAAPAMVEHPAEAGEFAAIADALLTNVGTLVEEQIHAIRAAVETANRNLKPWVLDPVAAGAISLRTGFARELSMMKPAIIRGNASEIMALAGVTAKGRGVDSGNASSEAVDAASKLAKSASCVVMVTGEVDYITDGKALRQCLNGDPLLTRVTGVGCAQGALAAACLAVCESPLEAALASAIIMGIAGEMAAEINQRPGSFQIALLDALDSLDADLIMKRGRIL
ncbi:MAG: hydroxyethylthiazole kinase [Opitutales bacterium]|nr:hydroxyethylthiazole kinase [Opitutales bacterium]